MNLISALIGIVALIAALVAFIPLLGWLNWLVIPVAVIGLVLGLLSDKTTGRNINLPFSRSRCSVSLSGAASSREMALRQPRSRSH